MLLMRDMLTLAMRFAKSQAQLKISELEAELAKALVGNRPYTSHLSFAGSAMS